MNRDEAIAKIKKCLGLSKSSNEHEAAAALRQAQKLMEQHQIDATDLHDVSQVGVKSKAGSSKVSSWEARLMVLVSRAFGCELIFAPPDRIAVLNWQCFGHAKPHGQWMFIGCGSAPQVAQYAADVLLRQLQRARAQYIQSKLSRCGPKNKTRRADLYCDGWTYAVRGKIECFAGTAEQRQAIEAFIAREHPKTATLNPRDRNQGHAISERAHGDLHAGFRSGSDAQLLRPVGAHQREAIKG